MKKKMSILVLSGVAVCVWVIVSVAKQQEQGLTDSYSNVGTNVIKKFPQKFTEAEAKLVYLQEVFVNPDEVGISLDMEALKKKSGAEIYLSDRFRGDTLKLPSDVKLTELRIHAPAEVKETEELKEYGFVYAHKIAQYGSATSYGVLYITKIERDLLHIAYYRGLYKPDGNSFQWQPLVLPFKIKGHFREGSEN